MKIIELQAENVKRLSAVQITPNGPVVEIAGKNGAGKQQPVSEPVLTPVGWKAIGEIKVGDEVIGSQGLPIRVTGVFPQTIRETYLVTMADGASTRCGPEHLWTVARWASNSGPKERVVETVPTTTLIAKGVRNGLSRRWALPIVAPVQFADRGVNLPVDPYSLGVILGDGHVEQSGYVTVTSWDDAILDAIRPREFWRGPRELGSGEWSRPLRHMGLGGMRSWEKFIPESYLWASEEDRWNLLAGLMDTDGTADKCWASFCSTSERLVDGVVILASSLGCVAKKRKGATKKYTYNGEAKEGRMAWNVTVRSSEPPFKLLRKREAWSPSEKCGTWWRYIDGIERVDDEDSVCIQVDAADGLYVTKDFILTHNTSVLDAIWWAICGTKNVQAQPIRKGMEEARIRLDLGEIVVTRRFRKTKAGEVATEVVVENAEGARFQSPQAMLDALTGELAFDPLAFARANSRQQFDTLRRFVPEIDFEAVDTANKADFQARTDVNRRVKEARAAADVIGVINPVEPVDVQALVARLEEAGQHNSSLATRQANRDQARNKIDEWRADAARTEEQIADLHAQIARLNRAVEDYRLRADDLAGKLEAAEALPDPIETTPIRDAIQKAELTNRSAARYAERQKHLARAKELEEESEKLTLAMAARKEAKDQAIASAQMPIDGLSFGEDGVLLSGVPFDQASDAEQLRASVAIAAAMNPKLRVIRIRDGSLLDDDAMQALAAMAAERDLQVWVERVGEHINTFGVVIRDGSIVAQAEAAE
jgi:hypothetical protein